MNPENYTKIFLHDEYILLNEDKIAISWIRDGDGKITDFKTAPRMFKSDLIFRLLGIILFSWGLWKVVKQDDQVIICLFSAFIITIFTIGLYRLLYLSYATEIQKRKIKKISVNEKYLSILHGSRKRGKKRKIKLPKEEVAKETALQLLRKNKLID